MVVVWCAWPASRLNQLATLSTPDASLITVQPWDPSLLAAIERAFRKSDLGVSPTNDGKMIRIAIPPLTEERRKELSRHVHKMTEEGRNHIRTFRREANDKLKAELKAHVRKEMGALADPDDIRFTAALPKTRSGKIMRRLLRDIADGRALGDTTTLADPGVVDALVQSFAGVPAALAQAPADSGVVRGQVTAVGDGRQAIDRIGTERPDIVHAHSPLLCGLPALAAARKLGLPTIYEIRALWEDAAVNLGKRLGFCQPPPWV